MNRVIDTHTHFYPQAYLDLLASSRGRQCGFDSYPVPGGFMLVTPGGGLPGALRDPQPAKYFDLDLRIKDMDAQGVAMQVLSLTAPMVYWADGAFSEDLSKAFNDSVSAAHQSHPDRFVGFMTLPMLDPERALRELERAAALPGIKGVYLGTHIEGRDLSDPLFEPVYELIAARRLPIFLHPVKPLGGARLDPWHLRNIIGNPTETTLACGHLIFGGVLDRHPDLLVGLPHAGGTFPALIGRFDHGSRVRAETKHMDRLPSTYLRRFTYDTITHSPALLADLIDLVGADRVLLGTDYCADMGVERPVEDLRKLGLAAADEVLILGGTAATLLGL